MENMQCWRMKRPAELFFFFSPSRRGRGVIEKNLKKEYIRPAELPNLCTLDKRNVHLKTGEVTVQSQLEELDRNSDVEVQRAAQELSNTYQASTAAARAQLSPSLLCPRREKEGESDDASAAGAGC